MFLKLTKLYVIGPEERIFEIAVDQTIEISPIIENGSGYAGTVTFDIVIPLADGSSLEACVLFKSIFDLVEMTGAATAEILERGTALHLSEYKVVEHICLGKESDYKELRMNRCRFCTHKQNPDGGWCYMFKDFMENCEVFIPV